MATFTKVGDKVRAQIRRPRQKSISKTWPTLKQAKEWARATEAAMDAGSIIPEPSRILVGDLIEWFRDMRITLGRPVDPASNAEYMLQHLDEDLGTVAIAELTPERFAQWARMRHEQGAGGFTVNMELSQLSTVLRHTAAYKRILLPDVIGAARPLLHYAQLIGGGKRRTRRPTEDEMVRLLKWLDAENTIVADVVRVAAITGMRRGELWRITWADVDEMNRAVLVRQRKHPRQIDARDEWVPLLGKSWEIVKRQPRVHERIFPVSRELMTDLVTAGTKALGIPDLRLHDMRREANSRLREQGFDQDERRATLGHMSDGMNDRYTAVSLASLHAKHDEIQGTQPRPGRPRKATGRRSSAK